MGMIPGHTFINTAAGLHSTMTTILLEGYPHRLFVIRVESFPYFVSSGESAFSLDVLRPLNVEIILGQVSNSVQVCTINFCTQIYSATNFRFIFLVSIKKVFKLVRIKWNIFVTVTLKAH